MFTLPAFPAAHAIAKFLIAHAFCLLKSVLTPLTFELAQRQPLPQGCNAKSCFHSHTHLPDKRLIVGPLATRCKPILVTVFFGLTLLAPGASAQYTQVSATVLDPQGIPYAGATVKAQIVLPLNFTGQPTVPNNSQAACISAGLGNAPCRVPFDGTHGPISLHSEGKADDGAFNLQVENNAQVLPASSQWLFTISISPGCVEPWGFGPRSFTYQATITGASVDLSAPLSAIAPLLCHQVTAGISSISVQHNGTLVGTQPIINLIDSLSVTMTVTNNIGATRIDVTPVSTGGSSTPCTTLVAGTWDIIPQTCAGEKVLQGIAGNPTIKNLTLLPASDQTAINLYAGDPLASFTDISSFSFFGDNPLTDSFHVAATHGRAQAGTPMWSSLVGYNEDNVGGFPQNPIFGVRCIAVKTGVDDSTVQACESEAYIRGSGFTIVGDAYSAFANAGGTGTVDKLVGFYSSSNTNTTGTVSKVHNNIGVYVENQGGVGNNNYGIFVVNAATKNAFFDNADTGHINIPVLESARLKGLCYSTTSTDTNATFVPSTCFEDTPSVFSAIGTCNAGNEGARAAVTDSTVNTWGTAIAGGSTNHVLAYCNGTNWTVAAK
jgi:hypothetical protein